MTQILTLMKIVQYNTKMIYKIKAKLTKEEIENMVKEIVERFPKTMEALAKI